jgi:hypothetical protein
MTAPSSRRRGAAAVAVAVACACSTPGVVGPEPRSSDETRWLAPDVHYVVTTGEPMFVVDGYVWMSRQGRWLRWHGDGWRHASPPMALEVLPARWAGP